MLSLKEKIKKRYEENNQNNDKNISPEIDPRLDLEEDSELWQQVLSVAKDIDKKLYDVLHNFRRVGAKLKFENNELQLVPRYGEDTHYFWQKKKEWLRDKNKYLVPIKDKIKEIFKIVEDNISNDKVS